MLPLSWPKRLSIFASLPVAVASLLNLPAEPSPARAGALVDRSALLSKRLITQQDRTFYKFVTRPDIDAPVFDIDVHVEDAVAPGSWFISPYAALGQDRPGQHWDGPHIYDGTGELIWSGTPAFGYWNVFDFESRVVGGERMLTLLSEHEKHGFILNKSYEVYKKVPMVHGEETQTNMHEFNVFDDGKRALFLTHTDPHASKEASKEIGFDGSCLAKYQGFREVDIDSGKANEVVFEWDARDHIGLDEATYRKYDGSIEQQCTRGWDILHLNSVVKFPDGDYLLSARHTDAVYKISHTDGSIVWRLGGTKSDFRQDGWAFSRQHHALVLEQNTTHTTITLFDNGIGDSPFEKATSDRARALEILLDTTQMSASILNTYEQPSGERPNARGSFQTLPNGNKFICWAYNSYMSEHSPDGRLVMEARIPIKLRGYRAFKHPWVGSPSTAPDIHSETITVQDEIYTVVHVSWNGDTRTNKGEFSEVHDAGSVKRLGSAVREGFETRFEHKGYAQRVFAEAIDAKGSKLGKSGVATTFPPGQLNNGDWAPIHASDAGKNTEHSSSSDGDTSPGVSDGLFADSGVVNMNFAMGLSCGILIAALAWAFVRFYQRYGPSILRKDQDARYSLLKHETD